MQSESIQKVRVRLEQSFQNACLPYLLHSLTWPVALVYQQLTPDGNW